MKISELVKDLKNVKIIGEDKDISYLSYNSGDIQLNTLFFCIEGVKTDGHLFAKDAVDKGSVAIVISKEINISGNVTKIIVEDTRKAMALISSTFYGHSSKKINLIGITGTNGKTTSSFIMKSILDNYNRSTALLGTIYNIIGDNAVEAKRTTPESLDLQKLFYEMNTKSIEDCIMEVSSHSLDLERVYGVEFNVAIFTNLTQDHLDYHVTMDNYFNAKMKLLKNAGNAIINIDDNYGNIAFQMFKDKSITYGIDNAADVYGKNISISKEGNKFDLCYKDKCVPISMHLPGKFNIYNALGCAAAALALGVPLEIIKEGIEDIRKVPGRSEKINSKKGFTVVIDYAHTPDGIINILNTAREYTEAKLTALFGCGGDRDRTKRPLMGKAAGEIADFCIVTSDNPRTEDPDKIIGDILPGIDETNCPYIIIPNRFEAIEYAINNGKKGDVIVIAGKGHETYQVLKDKVIHFDEREIVNELLEKIDID